MEFGGQLFLLSGNGMGKRDWGGWYIRADTDMWGIDKGTGRNMAAVAMVLALGRIPRRESALLPQKILLFNRTDFDEIVFFWRAFFQAKPLEAGLPLVSYARSFGRRKMANGVRSFKIRRLPTGSNAICPGLEQASDIVTATSAGGIG